jgi:hypothetical protein
MNKEKKIKLVISIILLIGLVAAFLYGHKVQQKEERLLKNHGKFDTCTVTKKVSGYRGKKHVHYKFTVKEKTYRNSSLYNRSDTELEVIPGDKFKVIYYSKNPEINKILFKQRVSNDSIYFIK